MELRVTRGHGGSKRAADDERRKDRRRVLEKQFREDGIRSRDIRHQDTADHTDARRKDVNHGQVDRREHGRPLHNIQVLTREKSQRHLREHHHAEGNDNPAGDPVLRRDNAFGSPAV